MLDNGGLIASFAFGFIPMFLFAIFVYWLDRYEKEPKFLLVGVFTWGAVIAAGMAFLLNTMLGMGVFMVTASETAAIHRATVFPVKVFSRGNFHCPAFFMK
jgi:RsiW-degrading membrane proteinase PrsW (M82 family)